MSGFVLERYQGQYSHVGVAFVPFLACFGLVLVAKLLSDRGHIAVADIIGGGAGLIFVAGVFAGPAWLRRRQARNRVVLELQTTAWILRRDVDGAELASWTPAARVTPGSFRYNVRGRSYAAPCVSLGGGQRPSLRIGCVAAHGQWKSSAAPVECAPAAYCISAGEFRSFLDALGKGDQGAP